MIKESAGAPGSAAAVKLLPKGSAHRDGGVGFGEANAVAGETIEVRRFAGHSAAVAADVIAVDIVTEDEDEVGFFGAEGERSEKAKEEEKCFQNISALDELEEET